MMPTCLQKHEAACHAEVAARIQGHWKQSTVYKGALGISHSGLLPGDFQVMSMGIRAKQVDPAGLLWGFPISPADADCSVVRLFVGNTPLVGFDSSSSSSPSCYGKGRPAAATKPAG